MLTPLQPGESDWLARIVANLADDDLKLVYADWLEDHGDARARFVRVFVAASRTMHLADFPETAGLAEEWLDLLGYRLVQGTAANNEPEYRDLLLRLARPALRLRPEPGDGPVGTSKLGGLPDLPPGFAWPTGDDCKAIYNDPTTGVTELAGFLGQINFAEIAHTQALRGLPAKGLLSFFCFQDLEHDLPDAIGARAVYFPEVATLSPTPPPRRLLAGNETIAPQHLLFEETLDLPYPRGGPWRDDYRRAGAERCGVYDDIRDRNFRNFLGYARSTSGDDPTPARDWRHLIYLQTASECGVHLQIPQANLAALNFDGLALAWVDFW